ncbi:hypothetical protein LCGC14_1404820 [marine sediment metagenome]|uniref:Uncharacterized protein n=1 Tax=marine sediment metagenome TaxID=412755 RepID=A0A0F9JWB3_9ZZZZ
MADGIIQDKVPEVPTTKVPQLSMKTLDERIAVLDEQTDSIQVWIYEIHERLDTLEAEDPEGPIFTDEEILEIYNIGQTSDGDGLSLEGRLSSLEAVLDGEASKLIFESIDVEEGIPQWGLEMVEALIEALHGVRLQGAQQFALALQAKYFPTDEVEDDTGDESA